MFFARSIFVRNTLTLILAVGVEFTPSSVTVSGREYKLWARELLSAVDLLLRRVGPLLETPEFVAAEADISTLWHGAAYQRHLRSFVEGGGDLARDLLLPLVFFSGL